MIVYQSFCMLFLVYLVLFIDPLFYLSQGSSDGGVVEFWVLKLLGGSGVDWLRDEEVLAAVQRAAAEKEETNAGDLGRAPA